MYSILQTSLSANRVTFVAAGDNFTITFFIGVSWTLNLGV